MPPARKHQTTTLPAALRDELGIVPRGETAVVRGGKTPHTRGGRRGEGVLGRKEARKAQRDAKKHSRAPPPQHQRGATQSQRNGTNPPRAGVPTSNAVGKRRRTDDQDARSHHDQHRRHEQPANDNAPPRRKKAKSSSGQTSSTTALERMLQQQGTSSGSRPRSQPSIKRRAPRAPRTQAEKDEDQEIRWLQFMTRGVRDDGFDELLEDLDQFYESGDEDEDEDGSGADEGSSEDDGEDSELESSAGSLPEGMSSDEEGSASEEDDDDDDDDDDSGSEAEAPAPRQRINPYGEAVAVSQTGGRYIPPAARAASSSSSAAPNAEQQKLQRKIKGLLNRLGDANVDSIVSSIEAVYQEHGRRAEVSHALARIIIETIASRTSNVLLTDSFVVVHATLVAALYRVVGVEFAAGFVQELSDDLLKHYEDQQAIADGADEQEKGRELTNLVTLASHLYNLQVIACPLVYDLVRLFLGSDDDDKPLSEVDVESLLRIVKTCGTQLRHDDSASLRDIVALAQQRAAATSSSSRTRFMLETLQDISTKSTSKRANAKQQNESPVAQLLASMQRYLGAMDKKRTLRSHGEPLRVVLQDLRDAKTRGKWWLVGAAWKDEEQFGETAEGEAQGVTAKRALGVKATNGNVVGGGDDNGSSAQAALLTLARKHGMNTDARRLVFITLMDPTLSVDYSDTAQRLLELRGPASSEALRREVVRVLLHCLGREREYNPFYALVGWKLALQDAGTRITMQFCLWDYLREIGEKRVGGKSVVQEDDDFDDFDDDDEEGEPSIVARTKLWHTSRAYGWWMAKGALSLSILRTVDFTALRPGGKGIEFLRLLLVHLLLSTQSNSLATLKPKKAKQAGTGGDRSAIEEVFSRGTSGNAELSKGLHFFLVTEMKAKRVKEVVGDEGELVERALWACEVARSVMSTATSSTD